jgi:hypothetical protein
MSLLAARRMLALALVVAFSACSGSDGSTSSTTSTIPSIVTTVTTTEADAATSSSAGTSPDEVATTSAGVDPATAEQLSSEIAGLVGVTEELRRLEFIEMPRVTILPPDEFADRVARTVAEDLDPEKMSVEERLYQLLGMLDSDTDYRDLLIALYEEQASGFYDGDTRELVVAAASAVLSPLDKAVVVHELVHALTDQHFSFHERLKTLIDEERYDEAISYKAVIEGDAMFVMLQYAKTLTSGELAEYTADQADAPLQVFASSPRFVRDGLMFPYEHGFSFVAELIGAGGFDAVNRAYSDPPVMSEAVLHPDRFFGEEAARLVEPIAVTLDGFEVSEAGAYGEWATLLLLRDGVSNGAASQAADGWGGDWYTVLSDADDVVFVWEYLGDSERDAVELVESLLVIAEGRLEAGDAIALAGGVLYQTEDLYLFIDRVDDRIYLVATSDPAVGEDVRIQVTR